MERLGPFVRSIWRLAAGLLTNLFVRIMLMLLAALAVGVAINRASGLLFAPGWPLAQYSDNLWIRYSVPPLLAFLCWHGLTKAVRYLSGRRWVIVERLKDLDVPSWVELRRLGESNAVKLTALAPVLGSLILMNDEVDALLRSTFLDLSLDHARKPMLGFVYVPRLHMIYLGLSLLGIGAIGFGLFCPDLIKRYASAPDWLEREDRFLTGGRLQAEFRALIMTYAANTRSNATDNELDESRPWLMFGESEDRERRMGYSSTRYFQIHALISEIVEKEDLTTTEWTPPKPEPSQILAPNGLPALKEDGPIIDTADADDEEWRRFRAGPRGHVNTDAWLYVLLHRSPHERHLSAGIEATASEFFKERVLDIRFDDLAHEHRVARAIVTGVYGMGIVALIIPTLHTFAAIVASAL